MKMRREALTTLVSMSASLTSVVICVMSKSFSFTKFGMKKTWTKVRSARAEGYRFSVVQ